MDDIIGVDFETYSGADIRHGLRAYMNHHSFRPLVVAIAYPTGTDVFDLVQDYDAGRNALIEAVNNNSIAAHNAQFEQLVLRRMDIDVPSSKFIDTAVLARAHGYGSSLEAAAPQCLGVDKLESGQRLIKLFSVPGKYQDPLLNWFNPQVVADNLDEWAEFVHYCAVDAELSLRLAQRLLPTTSNRELRYQELTFDMNDAGWHVDMQLVLEMQRRYEENCEWAEAEFRWRTGANDLNLNSPKQLIDWCRERGIRASSFDEAHVASMIGKIEKRIDRGGLPEDKLGQYEQVLDLLRTKQTLGGSSLKKLTTIINSVDETQRLYDSYMHVGAGQTRRTTGRGVQMQNLRRLGPEPDDMSVLHNPQVQWDNDRLAHNLRQVFTASHPDGQLIVGDFSSVESRGLAWLAGEDWKLRAYEEGQDLYKVLAAKKFGTSVEQISKDQRTFGKVGELSCGYQAGPGAVRDFAAGMGVDLSEGEAASVVKDWRTACPNTVALWYELDDAMHNALDSNRFQKVKLPHGKVVITPFDAPQSLQDQTENPSLQSLAIELYVGNSVLPLVERVVHGAAVVGRNIQYWKPSERKTGDLWTDRFTDPKTGATRLYTIYGGKLAGILTQSLCRELFFDCLESFVARTFMYDNVKVVGQFHDEIVVDWVPGERSLEATIAELEQAMTVSVLPGFPLAAEIKHDYRYTK